MGRPVQGMRLEQAVRGHRKAEGTAGALGWNLPLMRMRTRRRDLAMPYWKGDTFGSGISTEAASQDVFSECVSAGGV